jgi:predicted NAD/FAD-binding protein
MRTQCAGKNKVEVKHAGGVDVYDRVVMATHSDTARKLRGDDITATEAEVLDAIPYSYSKVYLHTGTPVPLASCTHE